MARFITISLKLSHLEDLSSTCRSMQAHVYISFITSAKCCIGLLCPEASSFSTPSTEQLWSDPFHLTLLHQRLFSSSVSYCCMNISPQIRKKKGLLIIMYPCVTAVYYTIQRSCANTSGLGWDSCLDYRRLTSWCCNICQCRIWFFSAA